MHSEKIQREFRLENVDLRVVTAKRVVEHVFSDEAIKVKQIRIRTRSQAWRDHYLGSQKKRGWVHE